MENETVAAQQAPEKEISVAKKGEDVIAPPASVAEEREMEKPADRDINIDGKDSSSEAPLGVAKVEKEIETPSSNNEVNEMESTNLGVITTELNGKTQEKRDETAPVEGDKSKIEGEKDPSSLVSAEGTKNDIASSIIEVSEKEVEKQKDVDLGSSESNGKFLRNENKPSPLEGQKNIEVDGKDSSYQDTGKVEEDIIKAESGSELLTGVPKVEGEITAKLKEEKDTDTTVVSEDVDSTKNASEMKDETMPTKEKTMEDTKNSKTEISVKNISREEKHSTPTSSESKTEVVEERSVPSESLEQPAENVSKPADQQPQTDIAKSLEAPSDSPLTSENVVNPEKDPILPSDGIGSADTQTSEVVKTAENEISKSCSSLREHFSQEDSNTNENLAKVVEPVGVETTELNKQNEPAAEPESNDVKSDKDANGSMGQTEKQVDELVTDVTAEHGSLDRSTNEGVIESEVVKGLQKLETTTGEITQLADPSKIEDLVVSLSPAEVATEVVSDAIGASKGVETGEQEDAKGDTKNTIETSDVVAKDEGDKKSDGLVDKPINVSELEVPVEQEKSEQVNYDKLEKVKEQMELTDKSVDKSSTETMKDVNNPKLPEEIPKQDQTSKSPHQSSNIISKVKHSIVKVKKKILGKSPSSKSSSTEEKKETKV